MRSFQQIITAKIDLRISSIIFDLNKSGRLFLCEKPSAEPIYHKGKPNLKASLIFAYYKIRGIWQHMGRIILHYKEYIANRIGLLKYPQGQGGVWIAPQGYAVVHIWVLTDKNNVFLMACKAK